MIARSSSSLYTAASSAGASPTSRFSASTGTNPRSSSSSRAAEYLAAQPPHEARSVSLIVSTFTAAPPPSSGELYSSVGPASRERLLPTWHSRQSRPAAAVRPPPLSGERRRRARATPCTQGRPPDSTPGLRPLLDGDVDEVAPFGPGAVVVLDVLVAEQLAEHEPRMGAALADPAVGDDRLVRRHSLGAVELAQLVGRLERAVVAYGLGPRDRVGGRDVPCPLRALLLVAGRRDEVSGVLLRAADVHERGPGLVEGGAYLVAVRPDRLVSVGHRVAAGRDARLVGREVARLVDPLLPAAVEDTDVAVAVDLQVPVGVRGEPVVAVAVQDQGRVVRDAGPDHELLEGVSVDQVPLDRILEVLAPVQLDGAGNMTLVVEVRVLVHLRNHEPPVAEMLGEPLRGDEDWLGIAVSGHGSPPGSLALRGTLQA